MSNADLVMLAVFAAAAAALAFVAGFLSGLFKAYTEEEARECLLRRAYRPDPPRRVTTPRRGCPPPPAGTDGSTAGPAPG